MRRMLNANARDTQEGIGENVATVIGAVQR